jgi:hypothetical protein
MSVDTYLAQDLENRFCSLFFRNGEYEEMGISIRDIRIIYSVQEDEYKRKPCFFVKLHGGDLVDFNYENEQEAREDRNRLLCQIEAFYKRGSEKGGDEYLRYFRK